MNKNRKTVVIEVDGKIVSADTDKNLLEVLKKNRVDIPSACTHPKQGDAVKCNLCLVEIEGRDKLCLSCETEVLAGMIITTESIGVNAARRENLESLFETHYNKDQCDDCIWDHGCELHRMAKKLEINKAGYGVSST